MSRVETVTYTESCDITIPDGCYEVSFIIAGGQGGNDGDEGEVKTGRAAVAPGKKHAIVVGAGGTGVKPGEGGAVVVNFYFKDE